jgi:hypothetical protein
MSWAATNKRSTKFVFVVSVNFADNDIRNQEYLYTWVRNSIQRAVGSAILI